MARVRHLLLLLPVAAILAACGGSNDSGGVVSIETVEEEPIEEAALPAWMEPYLAEAGPEVAVIFATSDYAPGENRVTFIVLDEQGEIIQMPEADVFVAKEGSPEPTSAVAVLHPLEPHAHPLGTAPHDHADFDDLYVATVDFPAPGRYWLLAQPRGAAIQGLGTLDVLQESFSPPVGSKAIPSRNPTTEDFPAELISTADPPHDELLRYSIADSIEAGVPFVVAFATPAFCQTRACGPTVDTLDKLREELSDSGVRFIHVEVYEDNDPNMGVNEWMGEWDLPTEPWVFVVDGDGVIRAKFEGSVSLDELREAVEAHLL